MANEPLTEDLLPCPFCGVAINRIESIARAFSPPRPFHEYHHPRGGDCYIRERLLFSGEAGGDVEAKFLARWNTRILSALSRPLVDDVVERVAVALSMADPDERGLPEGVEMAPFYRMLARAALSALPAIEAVERETIERCAKVAEQPFDWQPGEAPRTYLALAKRIAANIRCLRPLPSTEQSQ